MVEHITLFQHLFTEYFVNTRYANTHKLCRQNLLQNFNVKRIFVTCHMPSRAQSF